jgi:hypothetical protein
MPVVQQQFGDGERIRVFILPDEGQGRDDRGPALPYACRLDQCVQDVSVSWLVEAAAQGGMPQPFIIIDTLHIAHCVRRELEWEDVAQLDTTLAGLGGKLLLLTISPETLWRRLFEGQERAAFRDGYARRFGDSPEAIYRYFLGEQERMRDLCDLSAMQTWVVDANRRVTEYVSIIQEWWNGESVDGSCEQPGRLATDRGER